MEVTFWGVRGSIPVSNPQTVRYGGNTSCVSVKGDNTLLILDSGTGIRPLGEYLVQAGGPRTLHLLISHTHWDHIQGFPFFAPIFIPGYTVHIYGPRHHNHSLEERITGLLEYSYFPVSALQLQAQLVFHDLTEETFFIGSLRVQSQFLNHPVFMLGYRIQQEKTVLVYTGDNEPYYDFMAPPLREKEEAVAENNPVDRYVQTSNQRVVEFVRGADVLICDAQYTDEEYARKKGWGHTSYSQALLLALQGGVKRAVLFHHDPNRTDQELDTFVEQLRTQARGQEGDRERSLEILAAKEGETLIF